MKIPGKDFLWGVYYKDALMFESKTQIANIFLTKKRADYAKNSISYAGELTVKKVYLHN